MGFIAPALGPLYAEPSWLAGIEVWALSLSGGVPAWTQLTPTGIAPTTRSNHTAVVDAGNQRMVVFGWFSGSSNLTDVWALSLSGALAWTQLTPTGTPPNPAEVPLGFSHSLPIVMRDFVAGW